MSHRDRNTDRVKGKDREITLLATVVRTIRLVTVVEAASKVNNKVTAALAAVRNAKGNRVRVEVEIVPVSDMAQDRVGLRCRPVAIAVGTVQIARPLHRIKMPFRRLGRGPVPNSPPSRLNDFAN